jgi:hypothetical protein
MAEVLLVANPKRRRKHRRKKARRSNPRVRHHRRRRRVARRRSNPRYRAHYRRRRRNPSMGGMTARAMPVIKESFVGAAGAVANDALYNLLASNATVQSFLGAAGSTGGLVQYGVKMATALGVGYLARFAKLPSRDLAVGAATVATHDFLKSQLMGLAPSIFGSGAPLALSGYNGFGAYLSGSAPLVGTATFPATYMPQQQPVQMGAYLSGSSGMADGSGMYVDDSMGCDYWGQ